MTSASHDRCDVAVIGAGPAGSTIAGRLARLGHDVVVVDAARFPRPRIGESLPPSIHHVLTLCDVRDRIEAARFLRPTRAVVRWSRPIAAHEASGDAPGFQVDRARFDALLLDAAREAGARVAPPARAMRPVVTDDGWSIPLRGVDGARELRARFVVDAAGRRAALLRRPRRVSCPTVAIYAYWTDAPIEGDETRVDAGRDAWYWGAPLPDGSCNAAVFVDAARCAGFGRDGLDRLYRWLVAESPLLRACLRGRMRDRVRAVDASSWTDAEPVTPTAIKVGEAAFSIDALSSQGVQAAMMSGFVGATVVHTILRRPADADAACALYSTRQDEVVERHRRMAAAFYAAHDTFRDEPFWRARAIDATETHATFGGGKALAPDAALAPDVAARIVTVPTIDREFVRMREALAHPALERPVAYLGAIAVAPLVKDVGRGETAAAIADRWTRSMPSADAWRVLGWLWAHGVLVPATEALPCR
jgi:flavin-dependent dehydrogenase